MEDRKLWDPGTPLIPGTRNVFFGRGTEKKGRQACRNLTLARKGASKSKRILIKNLKHFARGTRSVHKEERITGLVSPS